MKRWQEDAKVMRRQRAVMEMCQLGMRTEAPKMHEQPLGRYRKKHALDCGNARCGICHRHKRLAKNDGKSANDVRREIDGQLDQPHQ